jgi:predicted esterase
MSQGGAMSLYYGFSNALIIGGVICLSGYLIPGTKMLNLGVIESLLVHGKRDRVVREVDARSSYDQLLKF